MLNIIFFFIISLPTEDDVSLPDLSKSYFRCRNVPVTRSRNYFKRCVRTRGGAKPQTQRKHRLLEKLVHFVRSVVWGGCNLNLNLSEIIWWLNRQRQQKVWLTSTQRGHASHSHVCHFQRKRLWCNKSLTQDLDLWSLIYVLFDLVPKRFLYLTHVCASFPEKTDSALFCDSCVHFHYHTCHKFQLAL